MLLTAIAVLAQETKMTTKEQQVVDLLKAIDTGAGEPTAVINAKHYTQHNPAILDGLAGLGQMLAALPKGSAKEYYASVRRRQYRGGSHGLQFFWTEGRILLEA